MFIDYTHEESEQAPPEQLCFARWFYNLQGFSWDDLNENWITWRWRIYLQDRLFTHIPESWVGIAKERDRLR